MNEKKIGEVIYGSFVTEFFVMPETEEYINKNKIALSCLLPDGWSWYDTILFDIIDKDEDGTPDEKYGKKFKVIYNGIIEKRNYENKELNEEGFTEEVDSSDKEIILRSDLQVKEILVKYLLL